MQQLLLPQFDSLKEEAAVAGIVPRDYQQQGIDRCFDIWDSGGAGALVRQPTGTGKTIVGALIARRWLARGDHYRVLVLAHERQLVHQFAAEIRDVLDIVPGIEMAGEHVLPSKLPKVTIASRQTLLERTIKTEEGDEEQASRLYKFHLHRYKYLLVLDEVHRWAWKLKSCRHILEWFASDPDNRRLGLTATPERGDKVSLSRILPEIAADYPLYDVNGGPCAVRDGWAVPYDQRFVTVEGVDFTSIREVAKDYDPNELEDVLKERETLLSMVKPTLDIVGDRRTILFSPTVNMARWVANTINEFRPEQAMSLHGGSPPDQRASTYTRHQNGRFQFLSVCGLCIAKGSRILTDQGEIPIESVTVSMRVWDGVEFVEHDGVIAKGRRRVIEYAGLQATEKHDVWTASGWNAIANCKKEGIAITVSAIGGRPVREADGYCRGASLACHWRQPEDETEEVYDILNAGPRHRFTANGLLVSNCREGYNDPGIGAVAIFRPTKVRSLAEQMMGRGCRPLRGLVNEKMTPEGRREAIAGSPKPSCIIVDLVGATGMSSSLTAAHVLAEGLPDEVAERATKNAMEQDGPVDMGEEVRKARDELEEEREQAKLRREAAEAAERAEAERRAKLQATVTYSQHQVHTGQAAAVTRPGRRGYMPFGKHRGKAIDELPYGYLKAIATGDWCKTKWIRTAASRELDSRRHGGKSEPQPTGRKATAYPANDNQKRVLSRLGHPVDVTYTEAAAAILKAYPPKRRQ